MEDDIDLSDHSEEAGAATEAPVQPAESTPTEPAGKPPLGEYIIGRFTDPKLLYGNPTLQGKERGSMFEGAGDEHVKKHAAEAGEAYEAAATSLHPDILPSQLKAERAAVEKAVHEGTRQYVLEKKVGQWQKTPMTGAEIADHVLHGLPLVGYGADIGSALADKPMGKRLMAGEGTAQDYNEVARQIERAQRGEPKDTTDKVASALQGMARFGLEFAATGGTAAATGKLAQQGALQFFKQNGFKALAAEMAKQGVSMGARTVAMQAPRIAAASAAEALQASNPTFSAAGITKGEDLAPAFAKSITKNVIENGVFGALSPYHVSAGGKYVEKVFEGLLGTGRMFAAGELSQDFARIAQSAPHGGPVWRFATAQTPEERALALSDMGMSLGASALFEFGMHFAASGATKPQVKAGVMAAAQQAASGPTPGASPGPQPGPQPGAGPSSGPKPGGGGTGGQTGGQQRQQGSQKPPPQPRTKTAPPKDLRDAYWKAAMDIHPDRGDPGEHAERTKAMQDLNAAYASGDLARVKELHDAWIKSRPSAEAPEATAKPQGAPQKPSEPQSTPEASEPAPTPPQAQQSPAKVGPPRGSSIYEFPTGQNDPDVVNRKVWYHGGRVEDIKGEHLDPAETKATNLYGQGLYMTDDWRVAHSYAQYHGHQEAGRGLYQSNVKVKNPLDLDAPASQELIDNIKKIMEQDGETAAMIKRGGRLNAGALISTLVNDYELSAQKDAEWGDHHNEEEDFHNQGQRLRDVLQKLGYDAMTHRGGMATGADIKHNVLILLDPANQVENFGLPRSMYGRHLPAKIPGKSSTEQPAATPPDPAAQRRADILAKMRGKQAPVSTPTQPTTEANEKLLNPRPAKPPTVDDFREQLRQGKAVHVEDVFDAAGLDKRERDLVDALTEGNTLEEAGSKIGLKSRQRAHQIAGDIAEKLGMDRSLASSMIDIVSEEGLKQKNLEPLEGAAFSPREVQSNPEVRAARRRAKKGLSAVEKIQQQLKQLATQHLKEEYRAGPDGISEERRSELAAEGNRLAAALEKAIRDSEPAQSETPGADQRGANQPSPVRREPQRGVPGGNAAVSPAAASEETGGSQGTGSQAAPAPGGTAPSNQLKRARIWRDASESQQRVLLKHIADMKRGNGMSEAEAVKWMIEENTPDPTDYLSEMGQPDDPPSYPKGIDAAIKEHDEAIQDARRSGVSEQAIAKTLQSADQAADHAARAQGRPPAAQEDAAAAGQHGDTAAVNGAGNAASTVGAGPGSSEPPRQPVSAGGGTGGESPARQRGLGVIAKDLLKDEMGGIPFDPKAVGEWGKEVLDKVKNGARLTGLAIRRLAQQSFPATHDLNRASGEALTEWSSAGTHAANAADHFKDKILGPKATPEQRALWGATFVESRLRYIKGYYQKAATTASNAAFDARAKAVSAQTPEEKANWLKEAAAQASKATDAMRAAGDVTTLVGKPGSSLPTEADYQRSENGPEMKGVYGRWKSSGWVDQMEENFRGTQGIDDNDPIKSETQMPDRPINLKVMKEGDTIGPGTVWASGKGNLKNLKLAKNKFANQATGSADAYDTDLGNIIDNSMQSYTLAAKARAIRTMVEEGAAQWGKRGEKIEDHTEFPDVRPPKKTQEAQQGEHSLYVNSKAADEFRTVLSVDKPEAWQNVARMTAAPFTLGSLASSVEAVSHGKNLGGALFAPFVHPGDFIGSLYQSIKDYPAFRESFLPLSRAGAMKPPGPESGTIAGLAQNVAKLGGKELPEAIKYVDPTYWAGRGLDRFGEVMRVTLSKAYDRMVAEGLAPDTKQGKTDFINQWTGNYERKAQSSVVRMLRDTGIGAFATAATTMTGRAVRSLAGGPTPTATSVGASLRMRASTLAKLAAVLGAGFALNYLRNGRIDGDDSTPFGAVKLGQKEDGSTIVFDLAGLMGLRRAWRALGVNAVLEGNRLHETKEDIRDKAALDMAHTLLHPAEGPVVNFLWTAATGENTIGAKVAAKPHDGSTELSERLNAAMRNFNPAYSALTGGDQPGHDVPADERIGKLFGPFAPRVIHTPGEVRAFSNEWQAISKDRAAFKKAHEPWEVFPNNERYQKLHSTQQRLKPLYDELRGKTKAQKGKLPTPQRQAEIRQRLTELAREGLK